MTKTARAATLFRPMDINQLRALLCRTIGFLLLAIAAISAFAQSSPQHGYIESHVPPPESFNKFLSRDLLAFFRADATPSATSVRFDLLRNGPTQSGVSYPKFYVWVKVFSDSSVLQEGAVRIAAMDRTHFEITDFLSAQQVKTTPSEVGNIFPSALFSAILERAETR